MIKTHFYVRRGVLSTKVPELQTWTKIFLHRFLIYKLNVVCCICVSRKYQLPCNNISFESIWPQFIHVNVACTLIQDIFDNFFNVLRCLVLEGINAQIWRGWLDG